MKKHKVIATVHGKRRSLAAQVAMRQTRKILMRKLREAESRDEA